MIKNKLLNDFEYDITEYIHYYNENINSKKNEYSENINQENKKNFKIIGLVLFTMSIFTLNPIIMVSTILMNLIIVLSEIRNKDKEFEILKLENLIKNLELTIVEKYKITNLYTIIREKVVKNLELMNETDKVYSYAQIKYLDKVDEQDKIGTYYMMVYDLYKKYLKTKGREKIIKTAKDYL